MCCTFVKLYTPVPSTKDHGVVISELVLGLKTNNAWWKPRSYFLWFYVQMIDPPISIIHIFSRDDLLRLDLLPDLVAVFRKYES